MNSFHHQQARDISNDLHLDVFEFAELMRDNPWLAVGQAQKLHPGVVLLALMETSNTNTRSILTSLLVEDAQAELGFDPHTSQLNAEYTKLVARITEAWLQDMHSDVINFLEGKPVGLQISVYNGMCQISELSAAQDFIDMLASQANLIYTQESIGFPVT